MIESPTSEQIKDVLLKTADAYEEQGVVVRGVATAVIDGKVCRCLVGHVGKECFNDWRIQKATNQALRIALGMSPADWQDKKGRTVEEIVAKVRQIAEAL